MPTEGSLLAAACEQNANQIHEFKRRECYTAETPLEHRKIYTTRHQKERRTPNQAGPSLSKAMEHYLPTFTQTASSLLRRLRTPWPGASRPVQEPPPSLQGGGNSGFMQESYGHTQAHACPSHHSCKSRLQPGQYPCVEICKEPFPG